MKTIIHSENAPKAVGPYSQAIISSDHVYISGQIPVDPATNSIAGTTITTQAEQVMKNVGAVLEAAGTGFGSVIKTTCFLASMSDFAVFNQIYEKYFISKPARSCVAAKELPKNVLCEVEVIAEL